jgi:hypothetical protein
MTDDANLIYGAPINNGLSLTYTMTVTEPGNEGNIYRFKVAASNALGTGVYSNEVQLMAVNAP